MVIFMMFVNTELFQPYNSSQINLQVRTFLHNHIHASNVFSTVMPNYCSSTPPPPPNTLNGTVLNRTVGSSTQYACLPWYNNQSTQLPTYWCLASNSSSGLWSLAGSCICTLNCVTTAFTGNVRIARQQTLLVRALSCHSLQ